MAVGFDDICFSVFTSIGYKNKDQKQRDLIQANKERLNDCIKF